MQRSAAQRSARALKEGDAPRAIIASTNAID
jgi:hypothetical protein